MPPLVSSDSQTPLMYNLGKILSAIERDTRDVRAGWFFSSRMYTANVEPERAHHILRLPNDRDSSQPETAAGMRDESLTHHGALSAAPSPETEPASTIPQERRPRTHARGTNFLSGGGPPAQSDAYRDLIDVGVRTHPASGRLARPEGFAPWRRRHRGPSPPRPGCGRRPTSPLHAAEADVPVTGAGVRQYMVSGGSRGYHVTAERRMGTIEMTPAAAFAESFLERGTATLDGTPNIHRFRHGGTPRAVHLCIYGSVVPHFPQGETDLTSRRRKDIERG